MDGKMSLLYRERFFPNCTKKVPFSVLGGGDRSNRPLWFRLCAKCAFFSPYQSGNKDKNTRNQGFQIQIAPRAK